MNDERFIEQLNAYIDQELSGHEIQEVEDAIASSPERQRLYRDYCKMERACQTLLAEKIKAPKPSIAAIVAAAQSQEEKVVEFASPRNSGSASQSGNGVGVSWGTAFAGLAAACVAAVIYIAPPQNNSNSPTENSESGPVAATQVGPDDSVPIPANGLYRTVLTLDPASSGGLAESTPASFAWMNQLEFAPIRPVRLDSLEFHTAEPLQVRILSAYAYPYPGLDDSPPLSETAAFQFQR